MADEMQSAGSEAIDRWREDHRLAQEAKDASCTVDAIAAKLGVPRSHVMRVVLGEAVTLIATSHAGAPRREAIGDLVADCLEYAKACAGTDAFMPVWKHRRLESIRQSARLLFKL